jgi:hypothetical protein
MINCYRDWCIYSLNVALLGHYFPANRTKLSDLILGDKLSSVQSFNGSTPMVSNSGNQDLYLSRKLIRMPEQGAPHYF